MLGEVKQNVDSQLAWLGIVLKEANDKIVEEEVARKQADEHLQNWFDQNQVRVCLRLPAYVYVCVRGWY